MNAPFGDLTEQIDYEFRDVSLVQRALNHRSARGRSNERLEFLGDAVLDTVISHELVQRFPHADEGVLSRLRAVLVRDASLAELAKGLNLGERIALGSGELKSGGARRDSILADAFEALLGAVFLDGGYASTEQVIHRVFAARLESLSLSDAAKDPKTELQEWLQGRGYALPEYELVSSAGPDHNREFVVRCSITHDERSCEATGSSRRAAEQAAARAVLKQLGEA
ncbi:MAG: ribonuclease III [Pseudomonadota bacterium]